MDVIVEKAFVFDEYITSFVKPLKKDAKILIYQLEAPKHILEKRVNERPLNAEGKRPPKEKIHRNISHFSKFRYRKAKVFDSSKLTPSL
jgi:hypothetical protein